MMINKKLIHQVPESKKYIAINVVLQWISLIANIIMMAAITGLLASVFEKTADKSSLMTTALIVVCAVTVRFVCTTGASRASYLSSEAVKSKLRHLIYEKLLRLGAGYRNKVRTSEVVQVAVEGVDQLETYFGAYLPQFFYAMLAPVTLFAVLSTINLLSAVVLLICVPLIPAAIIAVQKWAKKLLSKYWGQYTSLGDTFLENLQGLTTLKIYQSDEYKNEEMNRESENFRKITMRVLTMQLNSISIMDLIAYGGAAAGVIIAVTQFGAGHIGLSGCLLIILLSADFFIPMRQLGSFFHIAMNGMAASDKIFNLLELDEKEDGGLVLDFTKSNGEICCENLSFSYEADRAVLKNIDMNIPSGSFTAIVGESGCGKSTFTGILMKRNCGYTGSVKVGGLELSQISEESLMKNITYISHNSWLFAGTVRENLRMGNPEASEDMMWDVLHKVNLADFIESEGGLDFILTEKGSNMSGGQCQRLALARALLHDTPVYIFDEATSNIDVESEDAIMTQIHQLAKTRTVILISHRLANVTHADQILVFDKGSLVERGTHHELLSTSGTYSRLWSAQQNLENFRKEK